VIVADDSPSLPDFIGPALQRFQVELHHLTFNVGLSAGRNYLVDQVTSPYFVLFDDDLLVIEDDFIEEMLDSLKRNGATITSASVEDGPGKRWFGHFTVEDHVLWRNYYLTNLPEFQCRFCPNFFVANTEHFRKHKICWDEQFKIEEHDDFFLRFPSTLKVFHLKKAMIRRSPHRLENPKYNEFRYSNEPYKKMFLRKYGLKSELPWVQVPEEERHTRLGRVPGGRNIEWTGGVPPVLEFPPVMRVL
jgi:glycosyltransferase involved in cell wall biosynthesis